MNKSMVALIVVVLGVAAGWYFLNGGQIPGQGGNPVTLPKGEGVVKTEPLNDLTATTAPVKESVGDGVQKGGVPSTTNDVIDANTVIYSDNGFTPKTLKVKVGTSVTFLNKASKGMWVASAMHPTHQVLPGFDALASQVNGARYTYQFVKVGTWQYHNHVNPTDTGSVTVTE